MPKLDSKFRRKTHPKSNIDIKEKDKQYLDIFEEKNAKRMNDICRLIENSVNKGMSMEEAIEKILNPERRGFLFISAYLTAYKRIDASVKERQMRQNRNNNFGKVAFSKTVTSYLTDKEAMTEIYNKYQAEKAKEDHDDKE